MTTPQDRAQFFTQLISDLISAAKDVGYALSHYVYSAEYHYTNLTTLTNTLNSAITSLIAENESLRMGIAPSTSSTNPHFAFTSLWQAIGAYGALCAKEGKPFEDPNLSAAMETVRVLLSRNPEN
jgi:hypothetical protein